jgi:glycerol uptake facilitator-like aquaporin
MATSLPLRSGDDAYRQRGGNEPWDEGNIFTRALVRLRPDEGYVALGLILLLAGLVGWSIADSRWILGRDDLTRFLIPIGMGGAAWGYVGAKLPLPAWLAQVIGAVIGAVVVVEIVGSLMPGVSPTLEGWLRAAARSVAEAYLDLAWRHQISTLQYGHFCLILGILVWGTAQAASFNVFGHHRSMNGVLLLSVVFMANMSLTVQDQFRGLVLFSAAALGLLLFSHAADERTSWLRHRIWRGSDFRAPHVQGGAAFAAAAICGAVVLTTIASSAPLAQPLQGLNSRFADVATWLSGFLPAGGQSRYQPSLDFGYTSPIGSSFRATSGKAFTVTVENGSGVIHWRMVGYDQFQSTGWSVGPTAQSRVAAGGKILAGTLDEVGSSALGRTEVTYKIHVQDGSIRHLVSANEPDVASVDVGLLMVGGSPSDLDLAAITTDATDYKVTARIPSFDPSGKGITEWLLRHVSTSFPAGITARFTQGTSFVGSDGRKLLTEIGDWARSVGNPFNTEYDVAKAMQSYLQSDRFTYRTDISSDMALSCTGLSTVDCFAVLREGFCEQYATTMTMLMRLDGYPARYVQGYLPGAVDPANNTQAVTSVQKHAWVEVYFPDYGWIPFDPTGSVGQPTVLPAGVAVSPRPSASRTSSIREPGGNGDASGGAPIPSDNVTPTPAAGSPTGGPGAIIIGTGILSFSGLAVVLVWLRRPRRRLHPETAYEGVVSIASRLGYRPRPSQTMLEYSGMLAEVVPKAREPLEVVTMAAVEVTYGRRQLGDDRLIGLANAYGRVRRALLALFLRLPGMRPRI